MTAQDIIVKLVFYYSKWVFLDKILDYADEKKRIEKKYKRES